VLSDQRDVPRSPRPSGSASAPPGTSNWEVAASLSLAVVAVETHLAGAHRRLWSLSRRELAEARCEPPETAAPWAGRLLVVERPRGKGSQERS
jgi:hypothetical protein